MQNKSFIFELGIFLMTQTIYVPNKHCLRFSKKKYTFHLNPGPGYNVYYSGLVYACLLFQNLTVIISKV